MRYIFLFKLYESTVITIYSLFMIVQNKFTVMGHLLSSSKTRIVRLLQFLASLLRFRWDSVEHACSLLSLRTYNRT